MKDLGTFGGYDSAAYGTNDTGQVVGWADGMSTQRAFLYSGGKMIDLHALMPRPMSASRAFAINNAGETVGFANNSSIDGFAFLYSGGIVKDIGALGTGTSSIAFGINNLTQVVGESNNRAFLYSGGVMRDLGSFGGKSYARGINDAGLVVGTAETGTGNRRAFVYDQMRGMRDLNKLISYDLGWRLEEAHDINNAGQIVGRGSNGSETRAFLLTPRQVANPNDPPLVKLTTPATGSTFSSPAAVTVRAEASDGDGSISKVDFYANGKLIGTDNTSPYSISWGGVGPGSYTLTALATDNAGATVTSNKISITVSAAANGGGLPASWSSRDIGRAGTAGSDSYEGGVFTLRGAGADIYGSVDSFHYVYRPLPATDRSSPASPASIRRTITLSPGS